MTRNVLVTCLYDLPRREENRERRSIATYLLKGEYVLGLEQDLVIYVDPELEPHVVEARRKRGLLHRTRVYAVPFEELAIFARVPRMKTLRAALPLASCNEKKDTVLFTALTWAKFELLQCVLANMPFPEATHVSWIDFGLTHMVDTRFAAEDEVLTQPRDRVSLLAVKEPFRDDVEDRAAHYGLLDWRVAATYMSGDTSHMRRFVDAFMAESQAAFDRGFTPLEEQIIATVVAERPELFTLHHGDYDAVFANYRHIRKAGANLVLQMRRFRRRADFERGAALGARIFESERARRLAVSAPDLSTLLDEYFIAAFYRDQPSQERPREIARYYLALAEKDPIFLAAYLENIDHIRSNFGFLRESVL